MAWLVDTLHHTLWFLFIISIIVFVHEFGHYIIARLCGVRIETFSLGFGKELWGRNDRHGTRWKVSALPLGGYVKMFGDADPASNPDADKLDAMTEAQKTEAFHYKPLPQKAAIVVAGPLFNFVFAIIVLTGFFTFVGYLQTLPVVGEFMPDSAAQQAGLQVGDRFIEIEGRTTRTFGDIQSVVRLHPGIPVEAKIQRGEEILDITITPKVHEIKDVLGETVRIGLIGVSSKDVVYEKLPFDQAFIQSFRSTYQICADTLRAMKQMVTGQRGLEELGGPIRIAQYSGESARQGWQTMLWFMAMLSINLGLINLFPIPMLDGGHLAFYLLEAVRGRPMAVKIQEYSLRFGFALLVTLMVFVTVNDIMRLGLTGE